MGKKILIIDDDRVGVTLLASRIGKEGFEVFMALNGIMGLEYAAREKPDLIILDIEMPEMNGYTFILELKKRDDLKDVPVIVQTSHEENRPIFARRGIKNFLVKPVDFEMLFKKIAELIGPA